ncbi:NAD-dependent deacylase [Govanella unica]|uniref:NAD-dependent protein deacylase n=1 Tax=Govanella unica TaxID=2975056 RepID=A0A9X3TVQ1_9PROT|nr:NAD-dependent deacylase [Govania unica]MDA5192658.1 NAD-dependent deacylase [Govania unica]
MGERFDHIVILTGAGISAESGLDTFRDKGRDGGGIWSGHAVEDVATPDAFRRNPTLVHNFYNMRRRAARAAEPNDAHHALARLEACYPGDVQIITQNVDDLHERAGSRNLIHMHGELRKRRCTACGSIEISDSDLSVHTSCAACLTQGSLRPHIVWFGEIPLDLADITRHLDACDLFLSIGTSGTVYPAAGFVDIVRQNPDALTVELNLEPSAGETKFQQKIYGKAREIVPSYVNQLLQSYV